MNEQIDKPLVIFDVDSKKYLKGGNEWTDDKNEANHFSDIFQAVCIAEYFVTFLFGEFEVINRNPDSDIMRVLYSTKSRHITSKHYRRRFKYEVQPIYRRS